MSKSHRLGMGGSNVVIVIGLNASGSLILAAITHLPLESLKITPMSVCWRSENIIASIFNFRYPSGGWDQPSCGFLQDKVELQSLNNSLILIVFSATT